MDHLRSLLECYRHDVGKLAGSSSTTEASFYPAIQTLLEGLLRAQALPFEVRVHTSEQRKSGGHDRPDLAFYDGSGDFAVVLGEVKLPHVDLTELAFSTESEDQIGRYVQQTGVVLLCNVRSFGLLSRAPGFTHEGPIPPPERRLIEMVELWPSAEALRSGTPPHLDAIVALSELVATTVSELAPIAEPESLARILARQARHAKSSLPEKFSQAVQPLLDDFASALGIHFVGDEGEEFLRSSLIQTVFYGLFAGWTLWHHASTPRPFRWEELATYLKIPFLAGLLHDFSHPRRLKELGLRRHLDRAQAALDRVVVERFFARFTATSLGDSSRQPAAAASAILYFYEPFLEAFDPQLRKQLGVWYTPHQIVRYQVRKVDRLLREELGCARGFADDRVVVLDPCCGTGAYLVEVLRCIAEQLQEEGTGALLGARLRDASCRRILGFELLTAPFVIAQLQFYLIMAELGVEPDDEHRPAIFLTNALTGWESSGQLKLNFPELQQEHDAVQQVKREQKIIVILGNPPYNRWAGAPIDEEADLVDYYKGIHRDAKGRALGKSALYTRFSVRKHLLDDLYVRFFRLAEIRIGERGEHGIISFISNYSYLTGRSHPLMRESLLRNFDKIWIDSLNGDKYRTGKIVPAGLPGAGTSDQSVFSTEHDPRGIQVGTAITTLLKRTPADRSAPAEVYHRDFWGLSSAKHQALETSLALEGVSTEQRQLLAQTPHGPRDYAQISPSARSGWRLAPTAMFAGFEEWPSLEALFPTRFQGVNPNRGLEGSLIDTDRAALERRMQDYFSDLPFPQLLARHPALCEPRARYEPLSMRNWLRTASAFERHHIVNYLIFPFDVRHIYYETEGKLLNERRPELWDNLVNNRFLVTVPHARRISECRPLATSVLFDLHLYDRGAVGIPAQLTEVAQPGGLFSEASMETSSPKANLAAPVWEALQQRWNLSGQLDGEPARRLVNELFDFALALAHAPQYQTDHREALAQDWLRLPVPEDRQTFAEISELGQRVATLLDPLIDAETTLRELLGDTRRTLAVVTTHGADRAVRETELVVTIAYYGSAKGGWRERAVRGEEVLAETWGDATGDLYLNEDVYLAHVPRNVWRYELGGYPVVKKWLGYRDAGRRAGRGLSLEEIERLRGMIQRIAALLLLGDRLDAAYERAIRQTLSAEALGLEAPVG